MQIQFNKRSILPTTYTNDKGTTYFNTTLFTPVRYSLSFGEGIMPVEQMKAVLLECSENCQEVEIEFTESQTKFGAQLQIFSVKPIPKKLVNDKP
jgi:hypothetical protein